MAATSKRGGPKSVTQNSTGDFSCLFPTAHNSQSFPSSPESVEVEQRWNSQFVDCRDGLCGRSESLGFEPPVIRVPNQVGTITLRHAVSSGDQITGSAGIAGLSPPPATGRKPPAPLENHQEPPGQGYAITPSLLSITMTTNGLARQRDDGAIWRCLCTLLGLSLIHI